MKRAIALFLALIFVFTLIPVSALATGEKLTLTVTGGTGASGTGSYDDGATVVVDAGTSKDPAKPQFKGWTVVTGDTSVLNGYKNEESFSATADLGDPVENKTLTLAAEFGAIGTLDLTIVHGVVDIEGGGAATTGTGADGDNAIIAADPPSLENVGADFANYVFDKWVLSSGSGTLANLIGYDDKDDPMNVEFKVAADEAKTLTLTATYKRSANRTITFDSSGIVSAVDGEDDAVTILPTEVDPGARVYVRVASVGADATSKVEGITITATATDGTVTTITPDGGTSVGEDGFTTYNFEMPDASVVVRASYIYKISVSGATVKSFKAGGTTYASDAPGYLWAKPGQAVEITMNADTQGRTIGNLEETGGTNNGWTVTPSSINVTDHKLTLSDDGDEKRAVGAFTMPKEPVSVAISYNRALVEYALTVVSATAKVKGEETNRAATSNVQEGKEVTVTPVRPESIPATATQKWKVEGDEAFVNAFTLPLAAGALTFNMPKGKGTLTAYYVGKYNLSTVDAAQVLINSTDIGTPNADNKEVEYGDTVMVSAKLDGTSFVFDHWTYEKNGIAVPPNYTTVDENIGSGTHASTTFAMPASGTESGGSLTVTAHYKYLLTLTNGTASGLTPKVSGETKYWVAPGQTVTIVSSVPSEADPDKVFAQWTNADDSVTGGDVALLADKTFSTTTFTMPERTVTLKAAQTDAETATIITSANAGLVGSVGITGHSATGISARAAEGVSMTATTPVTVVYAGQTWAFESWTPSKTVTTNGAAKDPVNLKNRTLVFDMPAGGVELKPVYTNQYATVTVNGGTGGGTYPTGSDVTITANEVAGKEFSHWTFSYYAKATDATATTIEVKGSPYTFEMGTDVALKAVTATANYTQLYGLTLQNAQASAAGDIKMTRPATTVSPIIPEKVVASKAGETSIAAYWKSGDVISIETPAKVTVEGTEYSFTAWRIVSGSGTLASATSAKTTFTMTANNTVLAAQYGGNMLIYKTTERDSVHLYDNWSYAAYAEGDLVQLTAADPDKSFVRWACEPAGLLREADKGSLTITFNMPAGTAKVWPEYAHKLNLVDGEYSLDGGTTWTLGGGADVRIPTGDSVKIRPIEDKVGSATTGKKLFSKWRANSSRIQETPAEQTFTMPPEDIELSVIYQTYTLTVARTVNGSTETYSLLPGEYITLTSEAASGGRCFNYWTHTDGLTFTVVDEEFDVKDSNRLVSQRITIQMPASDAFVTAHYDLYPRYDYWNTDAFIRVEGEPKRYYARLEYFQQWDMKVIYYSSLMSAGVEVDPTDYVMQIVKAGTNEVATTSDFCFTQEGAFDILVTMYVGGHQMAPTIRVMDQPSTHLYCTATRAEFVQTFTKPSRTVYYEGEEVEKDGLDVLLRSADHTSGEIRYSTVRELDESEYKLKPWGTGWDADGKTNTKLPTIAEIQAKIDDSKFGYKLENGRYYVCMEVTDCFDYTQYNTDGSYMRMEYIVNDAKDYVWVEVKKPVSNITLEAIKGDNANDTINNVASTTYPFVSWEIIDDLATAQAGIRKLKVNADGYTDVKDLAAALEYVISDSNVAYLEPTTDPLVYNVKLKNTGVTTITFRALGNKDIYATCEITVKAGAAITPIETLATNGLNKSAVNLYVGSKLTLYPVTYTPSNANTTCNWYVSFTDGLIPQNADYYVSVSEAGVVEVLKYTDRTVRVWALPAYPAGANTINLATNPPTVNGLNAFCDITVLQIPVDNMTLYPAAMTMYRLASRSLKATLYPEAASDKNIRWTSTDSSVASVDNNGNVTANKLGTATITATSESNPKVYQACKVTVQESVLLTGLALNKTSATLGIDDTLVLTPYYTPATATTQSVSWSSNATTVATVDANGKVRGLSEGVAVITATATDGTGKQASCVVSVSTIVASAVVLNKQTLALIEDEAETLVATVYPTNVNNAKVLWTSSNNNVATVDPDGVVTAVGGGSAVITATAKDASTKYADCVVAVTAKIPVTAITLNLGDFDILLNDTTVLTAAVTPANATYKLAWTSSNPNVASVDEKGKVSGLTTGTTIITCKAGDMTKAITVNVVTKVYSNGKVVNCSRRVNVRANSSGTSAIVGYAYLGDVYKVLDSTGNWYKIQYNASTVAYIWSRYLNATQTSAGYTSAGKVGSSTDTSGTTTPAPTTVTAKTLTITNCSYCVNVRSGAGTTFSKLGYAYKDEVLTYTGTSNDWYIITYNGGTAYVSSQFVKVN